MKDISRSSSTGLSRRDFLKLAAITAGLAAAGCRTGWQKTLELAASPIPTRIGKTAAFKVAIAQTKSYDRVLIKEKVQAMLESLGGVGDLIRTGSSVVIKTNLTSGMQFNPPTGYSAPESYVTHPEVVRALGELLIDAGVKKISIVEAVYDEQSYKAWGYTEIAKGLGADLIDLNVPDPYPDFARVPTGEGWFLYKEFFFHPVLQEADTFISAAKMKCHFNCGITLSMKNLVGLVPITQYRLSPDHWWRSAFHGEGDEASQRLPRIILDLNRARPIHLALIDGIMTAEGGEVPRGTFNPIQPGLLLMGKNALATDIAATAAMGFDPLVNPPKPPFLRADNYLRIAQEMGMGPNQLDDIEVIGASIDDVQVHFKPAREM